MSFGLSRRIAMFLTLYYMAATWFQAWRLSSMRSKIRELLMNDAALVLYQEPDPSSITSMAGSTHVRNQHFCGVSSSLCNNKQEAKIADLMWYRGSKRGCSVLPQPSVDLSSWISFSKTETVFPLPSSQQDLARPLGEDRLHLLIEAKYLEDIDVDRVHSFQLNQFGFLEAWTSDDTFGVILETDVEHLALLCGCFLLNRLAIHQFLEIARLQTVVLHGESCRVVHLPQLPKDLKKGNTKVITYASYVEDLKSYSRAAQEAFLGHDQVFVEGQSNIVVMSGSSEVVSNSIDVEVELDTFPDEASVLTTDDRTSKFGSRLDDHSARAISVGGRSSDSFCSLESLSTSQSCVPMSPRRSPARSGLSTFSTAMSTLSLTSISSTSVSKPPNVLIYSDSSVAQDNVLGVLRNTLHRHKYTIYCMSRHSLLTNPWMQGTRLLVVCGSVPDSLAPLFLSYIFNGGRMLCLCSDFLHLVLPTFRTAEVRQHELVRFSYARWKNVPMMHHVFCYQASPVRTRFQSDDQNDSPRKHSGSGKPPVTPATVEVVDGENQRHTLQVEVLGAEETWQTPSLLLATTGSGREAGKIVFSQIHLEIDPSQYESEEGKYSTLRQSDCTRKEILQDLLVTHLDMECGDISRKGVLHHVQAYFLGRHELKQEMLLSVKQRMKGNILPVGDVELQFCGKGEHPPPASERLLPVLIHSCPPSFSTVEYFDNLRSEWLGRLLIYSEVLRSSMEVLGSQMLWNGLVVIARQQTGGRGRSSNVWISPEGCAMSSIQFVLPQSSVLGQRPSLIQHIVAAATVSSLANTPDISKAIDLRLKWPNDIYCASDSCLTKIGGLIVTCTSVGLNIVCNVGIGVNLDNRNPTTCINEQILLYNARTGSKVQPLSLERFLALFFTELERLVCLMQNGQENTVMNTYYKYWLHSDAEIVVRDTAGNEKAVTVRGVDEFGFLLVCEKNKKTFSVQPDGNTFDMCIGLIAPK